MYIHIHMQEYTVTIVHISFVAMIVVYSSENGAWGRGGGLKNDVSKAG